MPKNNTPRASLMQAMRDAVAGDLWMATYALLVACQELDLMKLGDVLDQVLDAGEGREKTPQPLRQLLQERWGIQ